MKDKNSASPSKWLVWFDPRRNKAGTLAFVLNRITGLGLVFYLFLHLVVLGRRCWVVSAAASSSGSSSRTRVAIESIDALSVSPGPPAAAGGPHEALSSPTQVYMEVWHERMEAPQELEDAR